MHFFEWMNRKLSPAFGPPPVTEYGEADRPTRLAACPLCGHPMGEHFIDHSTPNTVLNCPVIEHKPVPDNSSPLGELGMPASARRLEKIGRRS
ncbi:hypothetical protein [Luethyella okanaganae]|uniref:hypothetical protein n=1 Tax=Luethyella okanaganae TaxID=69372 RepID=UPI0036D9E831